MKSSKPIIIFGTGRSGTTVFQQRLSEHPNLAWLSGLCDRFPERLYLNHALMRMLDYRILAGILRRRFLQPIVGQTFREPTEQVNAHQFESEVQERSQQRTASPAE